MKVQQHFSASSGGCGEEENEVTGRVVEGGLAREAYVIENYRPNF